MSSLYEEYEISLTSEFCLCKTLHWMIQIRHQVTFFLIMSDKLERWGYERNDEGWSPSLSLSSDFSLSPSFHSISHPLPQLSCDTNLIYLISCLSYNANECGPGYCALSQSFCLTGGDAGRNWNLAQTFVFHPPERLNGCQIGFLILEDSIVEALRLIPPKS